ncbi:MAG: hypothetical protein HY897_06595 [Deltaproteobacteria bacterium]|nr:hypothetical protein [Deltaproteobacteria bacterium]
MDSGKHVLAAVAVLACVFCACSSDLSVPGAAQLACKSEADCPSGWACNANIGKCVKTENIDSVAPTLVGEAAVEPPAIKKGATATVSFEASEELAKPPEVSVKVAAEPRLLTKDDERSSGEKYVFKYKAAGSEPEVSSPVTITLTDKAGNRSGDLSGKAILFDFTPPTMISAGVSGPTAADPDSDQVFVKEKDKVTVRFTVSEKLGPDPAVSLEIDSQLSAFVKDPSSGGLDYVYTYTVGTRDVEKEGLKTVTVLLTDAAGNAPPEPESLRTRVVFDFTPPGLAGAPTLTPPVVKKGDFVTLSFDADEPLGSDPVVSIGGGSMKKAEGTGTSFKYTYAVNGGETEDEKAVSVTLTDKAGNESDTFTLSGKVKFDFTGPKILTPTVTPTGKKDTVIRVTFSTDEKLGADNPARGCGEPAVREEGRRGHGDVRCERGAPVGSRRVRGAVAVCKEIAEREPLCVCEDAGPDRARRAARDHGRSCRSHGEHNYRERGGELHRGFQAAGGEGNADRAAPCRGADDAGDGDV